MLKRVFKVFFLFLLFAQVSHAQTLQSPEQFLGYKVGARFTPHHKVVDYYRHVAAMAPSMVKLQFYGKTYEGRDLLVAFVSSATHISNLENIRTNNLKLSQQEGGNGNVANTPAVVWL